MTLKEWSLRIAVWRERKGFYTPSTLDSEEVRDSMLGKLMLVVTEVAEAAEAVRHNDRRNFEEEIADTFIRLFDICGTMNINTDKIVEDKMEINEEREIRHGKQTTL